MEEASKRLMAGVFSTMFLAVTVCLALLSIVEFVLAFVQSQDKDLISGIVRAVNTAIIALATFELGVGIGKEYTVPEDGRDLYPVVRRTVTRFVSVVCIALVLESLLMVIKYSQLELAGNLYYPVAVLVGAGLLLVSLGLFIHFTRPDARIAEEREEFPRDTATEGLLSRVAAQARLGGGNSPYPGFSYAAATD